MSGCGISRVTSPLLGHGGVTGATEEVAVFNHSVLQVSAHTTRFTSLLRTDFAIELSGRVEKCFGSDTW